MAVWCEIILALLAASTGLAICVVEGFIIADESPGTPGAFTLLHRIVTLKGVLQFLGGVILMVRTCRGGIKLAIVGLICSSMNALSLSVQIWLCGFGIYDVSTRCTQYPDYCVSGSPLLYAKTLLQCQEANFIIGTSVCLIYVGILSRYLTTLTSNLTTVNGGGLQSEEDKVIYSQLSNQ